MAGKWVRPRLSVKRKTGFKIERIEFRTRFFEKVAFMGCPHWRLRAEYRQGNKDLSLREAKSLARKSFEKLALMGMQAEKIKPMYFLIEEGGEKKSFLAKPDVERLKALQAKARQDKPKKRKGIK
ncbi:MAG: hypothetical protein QXK06_00885 [Candidatus Diapherotrites archaeon]